jgi:ketosteroid isomerase-like protein
MNLTIQQIAAAFSCGEFDKVYPYMADDISWHIIGENSFVGKEAVMDNCEQVAAYFKSVTTIFKTENSIVSDNRVAIDGTAEFLKAGNRVAYVWACDVYLFNDNNQLAKITSYCIQAKS